MDISSVTHHLPFLLSGLKTTIAVSILSFVFGTAMGLLLALCRLSPVPPLRWVATLYIDFVRSTPVLIQLVWIFFVLPILFGVYLDPIPTGVLALGLHSGAYAAEIFRTGVLAVPLGQRESALAQGMTELQAMRRIILPQAIRKVLPPSASLMVSLVKDSSLVSIIAVPDLIYQANELAAFTLRPMEVLTAAALIYVAITFPLTIIVNVLHRRTLHQAGIGW